MGRRLLAADVRRHRLAAHLTIEDVARHLECSPAKVSRMETGAVKVGVQDLRAVLKLYDLTGQGDGLCLALSQPVQPPPDRPDVVLAQRMHIDYFQPRRFQHVKGRSAHGSWSATCATSRFVNGQESPAKPL